MQYDKTLEINVVTSRKATQTQAKTLTVSELYTKLSTPTRGTETLQEYFHMKKAQQDDLKDVGGFIGGTLSSNRRKAINIIGRTLITLDFDSVPAGQLNTVIDKVEELGCNYCVYSTRKHTLASPRLRVVIPTDRAMSPDEHASLSRFCAWRIGIEWADPTTFDVCRLMYWPSCCSDSEFVFKYKDAPFLQVDKQLNGHYRVVFGDWHEPTTWPTASGDTENDRISKQAKKQGDPTEKAGIVGAFCRTYDVYSAIEELIPDVYEPVEGTTDRFTYKGGSTTGGAVVYDHGKFLFSHHATDPCSGRLVNSFDLVRLHKFGDKDDCAAPGTPVVRLPSYTAMTEYANAMPSVRKEAVFSAAEFAGLESSDQEGEEWKQQLDISQSGKPKTSLNNITLILKHASAFAGKIHKDVFNDRIEVESTPWDRRAGAWDDTDSNNLRLWLEQTLDGKVSNADVLAATDIVADENAFHPIRDYLSNISWDGNSRLDTAFSDYLGAEDTAYTRAVCRKAFTAAVARIMRPGVKYDCMTVLVGKQGRGKSTFLSIMGGEWFSDSLRTFEGKEAEERLRGSWIIEISELQGFERSSVEAIKGFLSKQSDRYRPAYGHMLREFPRQCTFFGTTNAHDCLRDTTGGRRFWPIDIDEKPRTKSVWTDLRAERDQISVKVSKALRMMFSRALRGLLTLLQRKQTQGTSPLRVLFLRLRLTVR